MRGEIVRERIGEHAGGRTIKRRDRRHARRFALDGNQSKEIQSDPRQSRAGKRMRQCNIGLQPQHLQLGDSRHSDPHL